MSESKCIKGVNNIATNSQSTKSAIPKKNIDFLRLYMFEKEKMRLISEETKIIQRLSYIHNRLSEINNIYKKSSDLIKYQDSKKNHNSQRDLHTGLTSIQIDY